MLGKEPAQTMRGNDGAFVQGRVEARWPAAVDYIVRHKLNEVFPGAHDQIGLIVQGGLYNGVIRSLQRLGLADVLGASRVPIYVLNVTYPLVPAEVANFCRGKSSVLVIEEGQPNYLEQAIKAVLLERTVISTVVHGKGCLPAAGEYTGEVLLKGLAHYFSLVWPDGDPGRWKTAVEEIRLVKERAESLLGSPVPARPPGFCVGCPERPVFSAIKIAERTSARRISPVMSAATSLRRCRPSISATPCLAMASAWRAAPASRQFSRNE
jgi:indolepyruvate ferredoxin oxidoreductase alpha subunit